MKFIVPTLIALALSGCATIERGSHQSMKIITRNDAQSDLTSCKASNEEGNWDDLRPNTPFVVHRDGNPLEVECNNPSQIGKASDEPEFTTRYLITDFLALDACIISCIIDGANNAFYDYGGLVIVPMANKP